jgi:hypothetical protein
MTEQERISSALTPTPMLSAEELALLPAMLKERQIRMLQMAGPRWKQKDRTDAELFEVLKSLLRSKQTLRKPVEDVALDGRQV